MLQSYSNFAISFDPSLKIQASNKIHLSNSISHSFSFPRYSILAHHNSTSFLYLFTTRRNTRYLPNPLDRSSHRSIPSSHAHFLHIPPSIPPPHPSESRKGAIDSSFSSSLSFAPTTKRWKKCLFLGRHFFPRASYMAYRLAYNHTPSPLPPTVLFGMASHRRPGAADRPLITSRSRY